MGYTYVVSDIHGEYEAYVKLLEQLALQPEDTLYVLGDVVDRGPHPIRVLQDMMARPNVVPLVGNHEVSALTCLRLLATEITEESIARLDSARLEILLEWLGDGGRPTMEEFSQLSAGEKQDILDYLGEFSLYEELTLGDQNYILVHGGLGQFAPDKPLEDYTPEELLFDRPDYSRVYFPDRYLVTGHTPTRLIPENPRPDAIYQAHRHIALDCGCCFGGRLGALRLEDGREFYT